MMAVLRVRLQPRASRNEAVGWAEGILRVRLTAPPVEGAANKALIEFVAGLLGVKRGDVSQVSGEKSRDKALEIAGLTEEEIAARILRAGNWETGEWKQGNWEIGKLGNWEIGKLGNWEIGK